MSKIDDANAYTEVYEILNCLTEEEYEKIPPEFIEVIEENRNKNYKYEINEEQDLSKQPMLRDTKAILLLVFRDYLATPDQRKIVDEWLQADRENIERQKEENYNKRKSWQEDVDHFQIYNSKMSQALSKENSKRVFFRQVINKIKQYLKI